MEPITASVRLSMIDILDIVRTNRNAIIKSFLEDDNVIYNYIGTNFNFYGYPTLDILKYKLSDLLIAPVDVRYYAPVIRTLIHTGEVERVEGHNLFVKEVHSIFESTVGLLELTTEQISLSIL